MPELSILRLSLPVVEPIEFEPAAQWLGGQAAAGEKYAPGAADLVAAFRRTNDLSTPTFDEAFQLVFGQGSRLLSRNVTQADLDAAHPMVASWVVRSGIERLRMLPVFDPQYGELRRADLRRSWEAHVEAMGERAQAAAMLPPADRERGLAKMDPLAALGIEPQKRLVSGQAPNVGPGAE